MKEGSLKIQMNFHFESWNFRVRLTFFLCKFWGSNLVEVGLFKVIRKALKNDLLKWGLVFKQVIIIWRIKNHNAKMIPNQLILVQKCHF